MQLSSETRRRVSFTTDLIPPQDVTVEHQTEGLKEKESKLELTELRAKEHRGETEEQPQTHFSIRTQRERTIHCPDCGQEFTHFEFPNHRDQLRTVHIKETLSKFQRAVLATATETLIWLIVTIYFREVAVVGLEHIPKSGPVVFYGNHQNQFIDALLIASHCGRHVRFIVAQKSMNRPVVGFLARLMAVVPVVRPQDVSSVCGEGFLVAIDGRRVLGEGTQFCKDFNRGDVLQWTSRLGGQNSKEDCSGQVVQIESDTVLHLSLDVGQQYGVDSKTPFRISRRIDHSEMYAAVYDTLSEGESIGIFPEGGSHDRTSLLPLKAGVALFALGAASRGIYPKVVPCGLTYFYGHRFRSRAHIEFGPPIVPSAELVERYERQGEKRSATGCFLGLLEERLRAVTINVPDWTTLKFLHALRRLYQPPQCILQTEEYLSLTRRLSRTIAHYGEQPSFVGFRGRVENYCDYLGALFVRDSQAATLQQIDDATIGLLIRRLFLLIAMGVSLTPFFVICLPIGLITWSAAESHAHMAVSSSSVKVAGVDVKGSYKLICGAIFGPIVLLLLTAITFWWTNFSTAATVFVSTPMAMFVSLYIVREFVLEGYATIPLLVSIFLRHKQFKKLYKMRQELVAETKDIIATYNPELEKEMEAVRQKLPPKDWRPASLFSLRHVSQKMKSS